MSIGLFITLAQLRVGNQALLLGFQNIRAIKTKVNAKYCHKITGFRAPKMHKRILKLKLAEYGGLGIKKNAIVGSEK